MGIPQFFITRPIFASVLSIVIVLVGMIAAFTLPIAQYPEIVPPTVSVSAVYPGADAETVATTVAAPIEQELNGVENMIYMRSQSANDGSMSLTVTFEVGTDLDAAQVLVQNRVAVAEAKLPEEVKRLGVTVRKRSPDMMLLINLVSPRGSYDYNYLNNYMLLQVRDEISRVPGVGDVTIFGAEYSIRLWLNPERMAALNLTPNEVIQAVREQNVQVGAGAIGQPPVPEGIEQQLVLTLRGRLTSAQEFEGIIIKRGADGQTVHFRDIGRVELGAKDYTMSATLDGLPAATLAVYQAPGSNAIATAESVYTTMDRLSSSFPADIEHRIVYDTTGFVKESVKTVFHTLFEAALLVILVVLVFLQNWRATLIPMLAVPVSIIGTFAVMKLMGFSLNNLSLFGLVLAIGIVVDDAIVVVETVEEKMSHGLEPLEATREAMKEVSGALVAIGIVLSVVFVPTAFIPGMSGLFYQQFALTIAVATLISVFNSLTLSPALCALLLKPHSAKKDPLQRVLDLLLGWFFKLFNAGFKAGTNLYGSAVRTLCRVALIVLAIYGGLLFLTYKGFQIVPTGFVPEQDKGYAMVLVQLPEGASRSRIDALAERIVEDVMTIDGVEHYVLISGFSLLAGASGPNYASLFVIFEEFEHRKEPSKKADAIVAQLNQKLRAYPEALIFAFGAPPVSGLGTTGGYKLYVQDPTGLGPEALAEATRQLAIAASSQPEIAGASTTFNPNTPKVFLDIDREKAKSMGVSLSSVYSTLSSYIGGTYVNDVTLFGRNYQVKVQAENDYRLTRNDVLRLRTTNAAGATVPFGAFMQVEDRAGPAFVSRYNMASSADLNITPAPGVSSGVAIGMIEQLAEQTLPSSMSISWTDIAFQQIRAGNTALFIFPLCVLFVFLVLAAQYESWSLPLTIILIVPMCLFASIWGIHFTGMQNNIFAQIGFVVLVGLACKNAILIVEFAKQIQESSEKSALESAVEAAKLRLRPILMTSLAFSLGVVPLMLGTGAGAEMRVSLGTAVFCGMIGVTIFGIFLTPVFYTVIMALFGKKKVS